jgi:hypothetical protein
MLSALSCRSSRLTLVAIDNFNVLGRPTQDNRPLTQRILALRTLGILKHLTQRRLPNVEIGRLLQMPGGDFRIGVERSEAHELWRAKVLNGLKPY